MLVSNFEIGSEPSGDGWDTRFQLQITNIADSKVGYTVAGDFAPVGGWPVPHRQGTEGLRLGTSQMERRL